MLFGKSHNIDTLKNSNHIIKQERKVNYNQIIEMIITAIRKKVEYA